MNKRYFEFNALYRIIAIMILCVFMTGCGYTFGEMTDMSHYIKQGKINAINYVREKYGFEAAVVDVECEKKYGGLDFSPALSGNVFVTLMQSDKTFLVYIPGDEASTAGFDNYQYDEVTAAFEEKLCNITNLSSEELIISYGRCKEYNAIKMGINGLTAIYFAGNNLREVLEDEFHSPAVVVSYINQNLKEIDVEMVKKQTGVDDFLFVDYDSKNHYFTVERPYYNIEGVPFDQNMEWNMPYVNEYLMTDAKEENYVSCKKTVVDGVLIITEYEDEYVSVEKKKSVDKKYNYDNKERVFDIYGLDTKSRKVYVYVPLDKLYKTDFRKKQLELLAMDEFGNDIYATSRLTEDEKYIGAIIYTKDYSDIHFSVVVNKD